jgi:dimethylhistidine N-methyltransferase
MLDPGPDAGGRFRLIERAGSVPTDATAEFARDVAAGLSAEPKRLHCRYFYDAEGSLLFDAICATPEYYLTRAEAEILAARAGSLAARLPDGVTLVELGSGSARKTRILIEALLRRRGRLRYVPIDISREMLESASRALVAEHPGLEVIAVEAEYQEGVRLLAGDGGPRLLLWLGSNVGNFDRPDAAAFLARLRAVMTPDDRLLLGVDLRKERDVLERAYDDARGVTARFNLNLLVRINRELGGGFALDGFRHRAVWNAALGRIDMYLDSLRPQRVRVEALGREFAFADGEAVHTESSYKYSPEELGQLAAAAGLRVEEGWFDGAARFCLALLAP